MEDNFTKLTGEQTALLENLLLALDPEDDRDVCCGLVEHLLSLRYVPRLVRTGRPTLDFYNTRLRERLAQLGVRNGRLVFKLRFSAVSGYSDKFAQSVRRMVEASNNRFISCTDCGRCEERQHLYRHLRPDGRMTARCGLHLLEIRGSPRPICRMRAAS